MARPKRTKAQMERAREHIVEAAVGVFARQGFADTSMQEIAAAAGFSTPTLYSYFDGKQAIHDAIFARLACDFDTLFDVPLPSGLSFWQKLELLLLHEARWLQQHREVFVFISRRDMPNFPHHEHKLEKEQMHLQMYQNWFEEHATAEDLGGTPNETAAFALWGLSRAMAARWILGGAQGDLDEAMRICVRIARSGISGAALPDA